MQACLPYALYLQMDWGSESSPSSMSSLQTRMEILMTTMHYSNLHISLVVHIVKCTSMHLFPIISIAKYCLILWFVVISLLILHLINSLLSSLSLPYLNCSNWLLINFRLIPFLPFMCHVINRVWHSIVERSTYPFHSYLNRVSLPSLQMDSSSLHRFFSLCY